MDTEGHIGPKAQAKAYDGCVQPSPSLGFCLLRAEQCKIFKSGKLLLKTKYHYFSAASVQV